VKVLVIPEDPRLDQYILKPVVERIFADLGKAPRITVLPNPRLRGVAEALNPDILSRIVATYSMNDLFLVLVDRDGDEARATVARTREAEHPGRLFVCLAIEEIEVWMLAIHSETLGTGWREIRAEIHPKERFAQPFLKERAPKLDAGQGRAWAMRDLGGQWRGVLRRCPELEELKRRIEGWLAG
jgi:nitroreductase